MNQNTAKNLNNPTTITKRLPHWLIASVVGCSNNTVRAVRTGKRRKESNTGRRITAAEHLIAQSLDEIKIRIKQ